ncbi:uncharacterized protein LOC144633782 [Oculina patagonica]
MARILQSVFSFIVLISLVRYGSSTTAIAPSPTVGSNATATVNATDSATNATLTVTITSGDISPSFTAHHTVSNSSGNGRATSNITQIAPRPSSNVTLSTTIPTVPPVTKKFEARIEVNETYKADYGNTSSAEFNAFVTEFKSRVGQFLSNKLFGFERVEVTKLSSGSVVVDFDIVVKKPSNATVDIIFKALNESNSTQLGYKLLGDPIVKLPQQPSSSIAPTVSPTKSAPVTKATTVPPTSSTKGTEIWDKAIDMATPMGTFIIVVVAVALIIILLIALICVCCKYRNLKKKTHFPDHMAINDSEWIRSSDDLLMWERNLRASEVKTTNGVSNRPINDKRTA